MTVSKHLREEGLRLGFTQIGICRIDPQEKIPHFQEWLRSGYHGEMKYMENPQRESPSSVLEGIQSIIVVGLNYRHNVSDSGAMISKYAWTTDYHSVMLPMLEQLAAVVRRSGADTKAYVDTGPVAEKYWAQKAGIGWIGKHTNVIRTQGSSWFFLGEILTNLQLEPDAPAADHCGSCERCIEICPTQAIIAPYVLDARLCISYLTIELRGSIPVELRPLIGQHIFGCDDCQDVCPWNRFAAAGDPRFEPKPEILSATLRQYLRFTAEDFRLRFAGTNVLRAKYRGFLRNCLVAAGNSRNPELIPEIERHTHSDDEMIREHALWALEQLSESQR